MKSEDLAAFKNDVAYNRIRFNAKHAILIFYGYENQLQMKVYKITQNLNNFGECYKPEDIWSQRILIVKKDLTYNCVHITLYVEI